MSKREMMRYVYIDANATLSVRTSAGEASLAELNDLVGGYIEAIYGDGRVFMYDNEDGLQLELRPTVRFPKVYSIGNVLRGPVVIMGDNGEGGQRDLTDAELRGIWLSQTEGDPYPTLHVEEPQPATRDDFGYGLKRGTKP